MTLFWQKLTLSAENFLSAEMEQKAEIFLQDFYFKFSAETEITPLSVDLYGGYIHPSSISQSTTLKLEGI